MVGSSPRVCLKDRAKSEIQKPVFSGGDNGEQPQPENEVNALSGSIQSDSMFDKETLKTDEEEKVNIFNFYYYSEGDFESHYESDSESHSEQEVFLHLLHAN